MHDSIDTPEITISILSDNRSCPCLEGEHGFSAAIQTGHEMVLFDSGASDLFLRNAEHLGVDLSLATAIILSHGHFDHSTGLAHILPRLSDAWLYLGPQAEQQRYSTRTGNVRAIGMPSETLDAIQKHRRTWRLLAPTRIVPSLWATGPLPNPFSDNKKCTLFADKACTTPDPFSDETALWVETLHGAIIIGGCFHHSVSTTVDYIQNLRAQGPLLAIVGGFHLEGASEEELQSLLQGLARHHNPTIVPCHCTGDASIAWLQSHYTGKTQPGLAGQKLIW